MQRTVYIYTLGRNTYAGELNHKIQLRVEPVYPIINLVIVL